jgi:RNA polymerase sigma-70 factor, ECF subfamily
VAVNSALQRARRNLAGRVPGRSQQAETEALGLEQTRALATQYAKAIEEGDVDRLLGLLTTDATWSMPPVPEWLRGHEEIVRFVVDDILPNRWQHRIGTASAQLAVGTYGYHTAQDAFLPLALDVLTLRDGKIASVVGFLTAQALSDEEQERFGHPTGLVDFERFGLPARPEPG